MSVKVIYKDIAIGAKEDSAPIATDIQSFCDIDDLKADDNSLDKYATLESDYFLLDGSFDEFPDDTTTQTWGLWSTSLSGLNGDFNTPIVLTVEFTSTYTTTGLTLNFEGDSFCNDLNLKYYNGTTELVSQDFYPTKMRYSCEVNAVGWDKIVITFNSMSKVNRYLKLLNIDYGVARVFTQNELRSVKLKEEISPISTEVSINTCRLDLESEFTSFIFQKKQPILLSFNDTQLGTCYVDNSVKRLGRYTIDTMDIINILDKTTYRGGIYSNKNVGDLIADIMTTANATYTLDTALATMTVTGHIPITTCREALKHVAFAIGATVDTSRGSSIKIKAQATTVTSTIPTSRVLIGATLKDDDVITGVEVMEHSFNAINDTIELFNGIIDNECEVRFNEPSHSLTITNGTITSSGANFAIINPTNTATAVVLNGKKYAHTTKAIKVVNPLITSSDLVNVKKVEYATLVSTSNSTAVAQRVYDYYKANKSIQATVILNGEQIGDYVNIELAEGTFDGTIKEMTYNITGSNLVANMVIGGVANVE